MNKLIEALEKIVSIEGFCLNEKYSKEMICIAKQALQEHAANKDSKLCSREGCDKRWVHWNDNEFVCSEHNNYELKALSEHASNKEGTVEEIAQWVISNRYPKSEFDKLSDHELYYGLIDKIKALPTPPNPNP